MPRRRRAIAVAAVCAGALAVGVTQWGGTGSASPTAPDNPRQPTGQALALAVSIAHEEAAASIPGNAGVPQTAYQNAWPANVQSVNVSEMPRGLTADWVGLQSTEDNRDVLVEQLIGHFAVLTSAPPPPSSASSASSPYVTGTEEIAVADASTGQVLDFTLDNNDVVLPSSDSVYTSAVASSARPQSRSGATGAKQTKYAVHGILQRVGGPSGSTSKPLSGHVWFVRHGKRFGRVHVSDSGKFTVHLRRGTYMGKGRSPAISNGKSTCTASHHTHVHSGGRIHVTIDCQVA